MPDRGSGPGVTDPPDWLPLLPVAVPLSWRGWCREVVAVIRRGWRVLAALMLAGTVLPLPILSLVVAEGGAGGIARVGYGQMSAVGGAFVLLSVPVMLPLAIVCGHLVARAWTGAVQAAVSGATGAPTGVRAAWQWGKRRCRPLWGSYLLGMAVLAVASYIDAVATPGTGTVRTVLALAGPPGILALVLCFAPAAAYRGQPSGPGRVPGGRAAPAGAARRAASLAPMGCALAVVLCCEVAAALVLSWLMTPAPGAFSTHVNSVTGGIIAGLLSVPGSVMLIAASVVTYAAFLTSTAQDSPEI